MEVDIKGDTPINLKKMRWDDMEPCSRCKSTDCQTAKAGHESRMNKHNACIDLMEAETPDEILKAWFEFGGLSIGFSPIQHYWDSDSKVILEIVPKNEDDIFEMNQVYYNRLREMVYSGKYPKIFMGSSLPGWVESLENDIQMRKKKAPAAIPDFLDLELKDIWERADQEKPYRQSTFRSMVDEELERIKRGINFFDGKELITEKYKTPNHAGIKDFDFNEFMNRIIAKDLAEIILNLEKEKSEPTADLEKPSKTNKEISYKWRSDRKNELPALYEKMKGHLIAPDTTLQQFVAIFTGQPIKDIERVEWMNDAVLLAYFIDQFHNRYQRTSYMRGYWKTGEKCFIHATSKITSATLRSGLDRAIKYNKNQKPKNHGIIDSLFEGFKND